MRRILMTVMLSSALVGFAAWADESQTQTTTSNTSSYDEPGTVSDWDTSYSDNHQQQPGTVETTSTRTESEVNKGLTAEKVGIKPQLGVVNFNDVNGSKTTRAAAGLTVDWNLASSIAPDSWARHIYVGPSIGAIYSRLGGTGSNFFGYNTNSSSFVSDSSMVQFPLNGKLGVTIGEGFRIAAHGGENLLYNQANSNLSTGDATDTRWNWHPNAGGDVEFGGRSFAIGLRPDWTFTSSQNFFTGTLELGFPIG